MNRNTKRSRKAGYCSMKDMNTDGNKIEKGKECNTAWNNPFSNRRSPHRYGKKQSD